MVSSESEVLLHVTRGPLTECLHRGHIAVTGPDGAVLHSAGDPHAFIFARSSMKPIQAMPVLESGAAEHFGLTEEEIAILCASHNGEPQHTETVDRMLGKLGLVRQCLLCGAHVPYDAEAARLLAEAGVAPTELHNNCSGKHAGMLALALRLEADTSHYNQPGHPVQAMMLRTVSQLSGWEENRIQLGIDGCGVPVFGLPLNRLAAAYASLGRLAEAGGTDPRSKAAAALAAALRHHPFMLAGTGRYDTRLIEITGGRLLGKMGAEGVFALTVPHLGLGLALKIEDGSQRAIYPAVTEALLQLGWLTAAEGDALAEFHQPVLRNWMGIPVGSIKPVFNLNRAG